PTDYVQSGLASRLSFSTVRGTTFGLGSQSGVDGAVSLRIDHPAIGATYRAVTLSYTLDRYQKLPWGRTPLLYMRLRGSLRAGDAVRTGSYGLGGVPAQNVVQSVVDSTRFGSTAYLRGYKPRAISGNQYHLLNVEYRHELWNVEHGLQTVPIYLRRFHI